MTMTVFSVPSAPAPLPASPEAGGGGTAFAPVLKGLLDENGLTPSCTLLPPDGETLPVGKPPIVPAEPDIPTVLPSDSSPAPLQLPTTCGFQPAARRFPVAPGCFVPKLTHSAADAPRDERRDAANDEDDTSALIAAPAAAQPQPGSYLPPVASVDPAPPVSPAPSPASDAATVASAPAGQPSDAAPAPPDVLTDAGAPTPTAPLAGAEPSLSPPALRADGQAVQRTEIAPVIPPAGEARTRAAEANPGVTPGNGVVVAPVVLPALQAFGSAMRQAVADERKPVRADDAPMLAPTALPSGEAVAAHPVATDSALDTADRRWPHAMAEQIERLRDAQNEGSTRIRLLPDALGPIDVAVRREGEQVHVHFIAAQAETRQLLLDAQPRLAHAADARGLKLGRTEVSADTAGDRQPQRQPASTPQPSRPIPARRQETAADLSDTRIA